MSDLTHLDEHGRARMVDVGVKSVTERRAIARATVEQAKGSKQVTDAMGRIAETVQQIAAELGKTPAQIAIAWVLSHEEVTCAISGADTIEQLDDVLGAAGWELPGEARQRLDAVSTVPNTLMD